ncbi:Glucosidase YgjK [Pseudocercospora fuligena]|uniref:Glucosidase YgjK n=1 Tax=Pseudocercospora fuligena TaxID=685502 RepID=A0A8H6R8T7_9PEZI|nr:Glucosidase YgjK [Pseudocercospora fuligena]
MALANANYSNSNKTLDIDVSIIPWSRRGSYFSIADKAGRQGCLTPENDVYLVTHCRQFGFPLFALRPIPPGQSLPPPSGFRRLKPTTTVKAEPGLLSWQHEGSALARVTILHNRCLRLRGTVPLAFDTDAALEKEACSAYMFSRPHVDGKPDSIDYVFNSMPGYRFIAIQGKLSQTNGNRPEVLNKRIEIAGTQENVEWELLVCELDPTTGDGPIVDTCSEFVDAVENISFDETVERTRAEFSDFARSLCPWSATTLSQTEQLASYVIWATTIRAGGRLTREAILMSKLWMNRAWSWDNCLNALGVAHADWELALNQLLLFSDLQARNGRLPDSIDWLFVEWGHTKPPIQGWAIARLLAMRGREVDPKTLHDLYTSTARFTEFWLEERRGSISRLPWYPHGNDSGWDNSTVFDGQSVIIGPECASYLVIQTHLLAALAKLLRRPQEEAAKWTQAKDLLLTALVEELWDGEVFLVKNALTGEKKKSTSLFTLMPLAAAEYLPKEIVSKMVGDLSKHLTPWGLATEQLDSPHYQSDGYWRGPIWAPSTQLIESGLRRAGYRELADTISTRFIALCEKSGFAENYDAVAGTGLRDVSYTWSAATYLTLRREAVARAGACKD